MPFSMMLETQPVIVVVPPMLAEYAILIVIALASCKCSLDGVLSPDDPIGLFSSAL